MKSERPRRNEGLYLALHTLNPSLLKAESETDHTIADQTTAASEPGAAPPSTSAEQEPYAADRGATETPFPPEQQHPHCFWGSGTEDSRGSSTGYVRE